MSSLPALTAAGIARRVRDGEVSPEDVVEAHLDRIEARADRTNAFVTVCGDRARDRAREAERAVERGDPLGPLHGVPVAVKDLQDVAGVRTTNGSLLFEDHVADESEVFVDRLERAGAVVVGKTNTPEFGLGVTTDNRVAGPTGTPFDPDRVSGGSSGGSGAALGDRLVPLAQGSDTGGSIRIPAACCGVVGVKPTYGLVPRTGRPDAFESHTPFSHYGPMARTVEDAALMLDVMAGPHPRDPFSVPAEADYAAATDRDVDGARVAVSADMGTYPLDPAVRETVTEAGFALGDAGADVEAVDVDLGVDHTDVMDAFYTYAAVRWEALFDNLESEYGLDPRGADRDRLREVTAETILDAPDVSTRAYKAADVTRTRVYDGVEDVFEEYDALVTATTAVPPFPHGEAPTEIDGEAVDPLRGWVLTQPTNMSGHPTVAAPAGTVDGLPVGLQVVTPRFADADALALAAALERVRPWAGRYPA
ncbi:MAG: amidase [Halobacteriaceae archaeon]